MTKFIAAAAVGLAMTFAAPAFAGDSQACQASWSKLDANGQGYVASGSAASEMAAMKAANLRTAREDQMTAQEYMAACIKDTFKQK